MMVLGLCMRFLTLENERRINIDKKLSTNYYALCLKSAKSRENKKEKNSFQSSDHANQSDHDHPWLID